MDPLTPGQRSKNMAAIKSKDTKPELIVRKYLWANGYRYRKTTKELPGKPDIVLLKYRTCIFINGCFWHGHDDCKLYRLPKTNTEFWINKVTRNRERDAQVIEKLNSLGWNCLIVWECQLKANKRESTLRMLTDKLDNIFLHLKGNVRISLDDTDNDDVRKPGSFQPYQNYPMAAEEEVPFGKEY
ncbi:MAG: very short patch repair endonuclease [Bacteroidales bacterium]|nr:very short patch repair endonuclease [Bacteroidales bacterium]